MRLMFQDEARFGRMVRPRRCWAPTPWRPVVSNGYEREFVYVYGAVSPLNLYADITGVISHKPVSGQLLVGTPQIHSHGSAFRRAPFLDDRQPIHAKLCSHQVTFQLDRTGWSRRTREHWPNNRELPSHAAFKSTAASTCGNCPWCDPG